MSDLGGLCMVCSEIARADFVATDPVEASVRAHNRSHHQHRFLRCPRQSKPFCQIIGLLQRKPGKSANLIKARKLVRLKLQTPLPVGHDTVFLADLGQTTVEQDTFICVLIAVLLEIHACAGKFRIGYGLIDRGVPHDKYAGTVFLQKCLPQLFDHQILYLGNVIIGVGQIGESDLLFCQILLQENCHVFRKVETFCGKSVKVGGNVFFKNFYLNIQRLKGAPFRAVKPSEQKQASH